MFIPSMFKSIPQVFAITNNGGTAILGVPVLTRNTALMYGGCSSTDTGGFPSGNGLGLVQLTNSTTVTATFAVNGGTIYGTVIEFIAGFLRQAVQYGVITLNGVVTNTAPIIAVGSKAFVLYLGLTENKNALQTDMASITGDVVLTSATVVTGTRVATGGASAPDIAQIGFCVVDPY